MESRTLLALRCIDEELKPIEKLLIDGNAAEALAKFQEIIGVVRYQIEQEQAPLQGADR